MDAQQLVKAALTLLADPKVISGGFVACEAGKKPKNIAGWKAIFPFVFVGPCGFVNIAARVSRTAVAEFVHEVGGSLFCSPQFCYVLSSVLF